MPAQQAPPRETAIRTLANKDTLRELLSGDKFQQSLKAVANQYLTPKRVAKIAMLAASRQPRLLQCTPASFLEAVIMGAEVGLDFGGATGQGYLVPYKNGKLSAKAGRGIYEAKFVPGYQGFIELAYRSGRVSYVDAELVYENDEYDFQLGADPKLIHKPCLGGPRGKVVFAYTVVYMAGSDRPKLEIMSLDDLERIRLRSKSKDDGPWVTDVAEMQRKTVLRRAFKWIPKTPEILAAMEADNEDYDLGGGVNVDTTGEESLGANGLKERMRRTVPSRVKPTTDEPEDDTAGGETSSSATEKTVGAEDSIAPEEIDNDAPEDLPDNLMDDYPDDAPDPTEPEPAPAEPTGSPELVKASPAAQQALADLGVTEDAAVDPADVPWWKCSHCDAEYDEAGDGQCAECGAALIPAV